MTSDAAVVVGLLLRSVLNVFVSPGKEIDRCMLAGNFDQGVGLITCEWALLSHKANHEPLRGSA